MCRQKSVSMPSTTLAGNNEPSGRDPFHFFKIDYALVVGVPSSSSRNDRAAGHDRDHGRSRAVANDGDERGEGHDGGDMRGDSCAHAFLKGGQAAGRPAQRPGLRLWHATRLAVTRRDGGTTAAPTRGRPNRKRADRVLPTAGAEKGTKEAAPRRLSVLLTVTADWTGSGP